MSTYTSPFVSFTDVFPVPVDRYGVVYLAMCRVTGKQYVGQTVNEPEDRWNHHRLGPDKGVSLIHEAIVKYGEEAFELETLDWAATKDELDDKERYWIATLGTISKGGYNLKDGGANGKPHPDTVLKWKASRKDWTMPADHPWRQKGRPSNNKGKKMSPEAVEQNRQRALARFAAGWVHPCLGRKVSLEHLEVCRANGRMPKPSRRKAIKCVETGEVFDGAVTAIKAFAERGQKLHSSALTTVLDNPDRTAGGYHWVSADNKTRASWKGRSRTEEEKIAHSARMKQHYETRDGTNKGRVFAKHRKAVVCVETGQPFESLNEAGTWALAQMGKTEKEWTSGRRISDAIKNGHAAYGYHWEYVSKETP